MANLTLEPDGTVRSKLQLVEFRRNVQRLYAGTCRHCIVRENGRLRVAWKRVDLVNCDGELDGLVIIF